MLLLPLLLLLLPPPGAAMPQRPAAPALQAPALPPRRNACAVASLKSKSGPVKACVGVYVVDLSEVDLKTQSYFADFYLWIRWRGAANLGDIELVNGDSVKRSGEYTDFFDGFHYSYAHIQGRFRDKFDLGRYPLDQHRLTIEVESVVASVEDMVFATDDETGMAPGLEIPGWQVLAPTARTAPYTYPTDFGDMTETKHATYSRFTFEIPIRRPRLAIYLKTFLALFMAVGIALIAGILRPSEVEPRLGVGVASIFGVVSSYLVTEGDLPQIAQFTLADRIHIAAMALVFLSILLTVVVYRISKSGRPALAERLDKAIGLGLFAAFTVTVVCLSLA